MKLTCITITALLLTVASTGAAQDPFTAIELEVADNNTALASLTNSNKAADFSDASENNLADPEVEFEHLWGDGPVKWNIGVSQSFDWPGSYGARRRASDAKAEARAMMLATERADIMFKARQLMLEIVGIRQQMQFADSLIMNLERLLNTTRLAVERGQATRLDQSKAEFALLSLREEREKYIGLLDNSRSQLAAMNGGKAVDISALDHYPDAELLDEASYIKAFDSNSPYSSVLHAKMAAARSEAAATRMAAFPSFTVGYRHAYEEATHYNGFSVGMTLPFFSSRHKRKAAEALTKAESLDADTYIIGRHAAIMADVAAAHRMKARLNDFDRVFGTADYTGILNRLYENGQINVIDYINEINYYLGVRREYLQLMNDYQLTLAGLNRYL